jgi:glutaredoxin 3
LTTWASNGKVPHSDSAKVVIFSLEDCTYCDKAKALLEPKVSSGDYQVHYLDGPRAIENSEAVQDAIAAKYDHETMPAIFIHGEFIGGFSELQAKEDNGELAKLLAYKVLAH